MEDDPAAADDERIIELSTIAAIYPEIVVDENDPYTVTLELAVTPVKPLRILFKPTTDSAPPTLPTPPTSTDRGQDDVENRLAAQQPLPLDEHELSHLPPLSLRITLPPGYPTTEFPDVSVSVTLQWLGRGVIKRLKDDCARLWEEIGRDQVMYTYIDHVQQEADQAFRLASETSVSLSSNLKLALLDFDLKTKRENFEKGTFDCGICLEPKKGINCHKMLQCGHVYCVPCLQDYYNNCITEGDVDNVKCMDPTCGKDEPARTGPEDRPLKRRKRDRTLNPSELLQIPIEQEQVQRYVKLKRKKLLESDKNTVYCPRQWCQGAARSKKHPKPTDAMNDSQDSESEGDDQPRDTIDLETLSMAERLAICEDCDFAFCVVCKRSWHGENARCSPRRQNELNEEERATAEYFQKYSTPCPTCNAPAQKTMGCNHMTCFKCKTHFCYLCASFLMPENPYRHYNDTTSPCYLKLWVLEEGDGEGVDRGAFHNADVVAEWEVAAAAEDSDSEDELPPEDFNAFRGPRLFMDEEDSDNEEPAPDQRRNRNVIEIVLPGAQAHRIELPDRPRGAAPPPQAPNPPRGRQRPRGVGQQGNRARAMAHEPARNNRGQGQPRARVGQPAARAPRDIRVEEGLDGLGQANPHIFPDDDDDDDDAGPAGPLPPAAPGQGNQQAGPIRGMGIEQFLQLAQEDREDEWDSDELDEDDFRGMEFEHEPRRREMGWR